jgi:hypothetical protein
MGGMLVLLLIADWVKGRLSWDEVQRAVTITCSVGGGIGLFLYAIGWAFAATIGESGLYGPTLWWRTTIGWNDIASVRRVTVKGIPYLLVRSRSSNKKIWLCTLGFKEKPILERLQDFIPTSDSDKIRGNSV